MKYIRKYESFLNDENRNSIAENPKYNAANQLAAKNYVETIFNKGSGAEVNALCKEIGLSAPKTDEELEAIQEEAIKYYIENPERIKSFDQEIRKYQHNGGSNIVTTNNIGGTFKESISNDEDDLLKIELSDSEMKLFGTESLLMKLINNNKISLHDHEVWFDKDDNETRKILDIFLEIND